MIVIAYNSAGESPPSKPITIQTPKEFAVVSLTDNEFHCKQSDGKLIIQVLRKGVTRGRVVVPWITESKSPAFHDLKGVETFKDGEDDSHIEIDLPQDPTDEDVASFIVRLGEPTGAAVLSELSSCQVNVHYDVMFSYLTFNDTETITVRQTQESVEIPVIRKGSNSGKNIHLCASSFLLSTPMSPFFIIVFKNFRT